MESLQDASVSKNTSTIHFSQHFSTSAIHSGNNRHLEGNLNYSDHMSNSDLLRESAERCLALLEEAEHCVLVSSEKAAIMAICHTLLPGDHVLCIGDVIGEFGRCLIDVVDKMNISSSFLGPSTDIGDVLSALLRTTKLIWLETPTNPSLKILDIGEIVGRVRKQNRDVVVVVNNTILSPFFQRPLTLGADVSFHSASAYLDGSSETQLGALIFNNHELNVKIKAIEDAFGLAPSPLSCFLLSTGIKTLALRMKEHSNSAVKIAAFLQKHPSVSRVTYPGLTSQANHKLFMEQTAGYGGLVSFHMSDLEEARRFQSKLKIFMPVETIGSHESRIRLFPNYDSSEVLIRLSVGLEDFEDLLHDIKQALQDLERQEEN